MSNLVGRVYGKMVRSCSQRVGAELKEVSGMGGAGGRSYAKLTRRRGAVERVAQKVGRQLMELVGENLENERSGSG